MPDNFEQSPTTNPPSPTVAEQYLPSTGGGDGEFVCLNGARPLTTSETEAAVLCRDDDPNSWLDNIADDPLRFTAGLLAGAIISGGVIAADRLRRRFNA